MERRHFLRLTTAAAAGLGLPALSELANATDLPATIRLDYATYSPPSLVLKKFGWLEEDLKSSGTNVKWVQSQGSNRALEFLNSDSIDFGSTAGLDPHLASSELEAGSRLIYRNINFNF